MLNGYSCTLKTALASLWLISSILDLLMRRHLLVFASAFLILLTGCSAAEESVSEPTSASSMLAQEPGTPVALEQVEEPAGLVRVEGEAYYVTTASDGVYFVAAASDCGYAPTGAKWDETGALAVAAVELTSCLTEESYWQVKLPEGEEVPANYESYVTVDKLERVRTT